MLLTDKCKGKYLMLLTDKCKVENYSFHICWCPYYGCASSLNFCGILVIADSFNWLFKQNGG